MTSMASLLFIVESPWQASRERLNSLTVVNPMASKVRPSTRELARHITRAVYEAADGQPRRFSMLSTIPGATAASVLYTGIWIPSARAAAGASFT
jgi:hypothetical protein